MGMAKQFELVLNNAGPVHPGETIDGQVLVDSSEDISLKGIRVQFVGRCEISWKVSDRVRHDSEEYLDTKLTLFGNEARDGDDVILMAGKHKFPFTFVLPMVPGSFEAGYGSFVRYHAKAILDKGKKVNREDTKTFIVASMLDLNTLQNVNDPVQQTSSNTPCCFGCCFSAPVTASFRLNKTGYVPGETFSIHGEVHDGANIGLRCTVVSLVQSTYLTPEGLTIGPERGGGFKLVVELKHGRLEPGGTDVWNGDQLQIPPLPPSNLNGCSKMDIKYHIKVLVVMENSCGTLVMQLPVIIGSVPLNSNVPQIQTIPSNLTNASQQRLPITQQPQGNIAPTAPGIEPSVTGIGEPTEDPPPSYQEYVLGQVNTTEDWEQYTADNLNSVPSYTHQENRI